jgi:hypothetical protein
MAKEQVRSLKQMWTPKMTKILWRDSSISLSKMERPAVMKDLRLRSHSPVTRTSWLTNMAISMT